jgi:hypothetical protein
MHDGRMDCSDDPMIHCGSAQRDGNGFQVVRFTNDFKARHQIFGISDRNSIVLQRVRSS